MNPFLNVVYRERFLLLLLIGLNVLSSLLWLKSSGIPVPVDDAAQYLHIGQNITQGRFSLNGINPTMAREPFYPLIIAFLWITTQNLIIPIIVFQIVILISLGVVFFLFLRQYDIVAAKIGSILLSVFPVLSYYSIQILTEVLFTFLLFTSLTLLISGLDKKKKGWIIVAGLLTGVATLTRSIVLLFPAFLILYCLFFQRQWLRSFCLFFLSALVVVLPWSIRNQMIFSTFSPTSGGSHLLLVRGIRSEYTASEMKQYLYYATLGSSASFEEETVYSKRSRDLFAFKEARDYALKLEQGGLSSQEIEKSVQSEAVQKIRQNIGPYLLQNPMEIIKLNAPPVSIFHLIFRPTIVIDVMFVLLYLFVYTIAFTMIFHVKKKGFGKVKNVVLILSLFLLYYNLTLSFFDAFPRYNVPLIPIYLLFLSLWISHLSHKKKSTPTE